MDNVKKLTLRKKLLFSSLSLLLFLMVLELFLRLLVKPSALCYGTLMGTELPPVKIIYYQLDNERQPQKIPAPSPSLMHVENAGEPKIADHDLRGVNRVDTTLGYAPRENTVSPNGWWKANNLGARSSSETSKKRMPGKKRILFFGESFTNCSRVRQNETWPCFLSREQKGLEAVNFGVDGYGMGQCFLRYRGLRSRIDHDGVVLVFAPSCDLERDINICRDLWRWETHTFMPRFRVQSDTLLLMKSPQTGVRFTSRILSEENLNYLRSYDSFYFPAKYESPPLIGGFVLYKLFARSCYVDRESRLNRGLMEPGSEAMLVTRRIFREMEKEAKGEGKKFMLFTLPVGDDAKKYRNDRSFKKKWDGVVASLKGDGNTSADLMQELLEAPAERMDTGCDGTHYGPKANLFIAGIVAKHLKARGLIPSE
jgi:hypothetical protein